MFSPDLEPVRVVPPRVKAGDVGPPHIKAVTQSGVPILIAARPPWVEPPLQDYGQPGHTFVESGSGVFDAEVAAFTGQGNLWKTLYAASERALVVVSTGSFELRYVDLKGNTVRSVRRPFDRIPIPDTFFDCDSNGPMPTLQHADGRTLAITPQKLERAEFPATFPAVDAILVDATGHIWVSRDEMDVEYVVRHRLIRRRGA